MSSPLRGLGPSPAARALAFCGRHLGLLQLGLFAMVWLLYGSLALHGHGRDYFARATDFWLERDPHRFDGTPGVENVLLPGVAALLAKAGSAVGIGLSESRFALVALAPYPIFIAGLTWIVRSGRRELTLPGDRVLACVAALAMYTSGIVPYMASWGGYVDGLSYLLLLPVLLWPQSVAVYAAAFVLQCLNHYLGAVALLLLAFVWHGMQAASQPEATAASRYPGPSHDTAAASARAGHGRRVSARSPMRILLVKAVVSAIVLAAFLWFWNAQYPEAARVRQQIALDKWSDPDGVVREVLGPFPWTLLSALKLTIVPVVALMMAPLPRRTTRAVVLAAPFAAAIVLTFVFVDVTRVTTMLVLPALLVTILVAADPRTDAATRRRLRRLLLATAVLNLLVPNYYVNNGEVHVPPAVMLRTAIEWMLR